MPQHYDILSGLLFSPILAARQVVKGLYLDEFCCFFIISFKQQCEYIGNLKIFERAVWFLRLFTLSQTVQQLKSQKQQHVWYK